MEASRAPLRTVDDMHWRDRESPSPGGVDFERETGGSERAFVGSLAAFLRILPAPEQPILPLLTPRLRECPMKRSDR